jgi:predicted nucleotidyltransferase
VKPPKPDRVARETRELKGHATAIARLLDALRRYQPERVYLFGSWARGEADDLSDLDVVIIKRTTAPFFDRLSQVASLLPAGLGGVDVLVYTPEEFAAMQGDGNAFAEMIVEEAELIYAWEAES